LIEHSRASLARIGVVTGALLRQNRILLVSVVLWPFALSLILLVATGGQPGVADTLSILHQELFYGLVLVGLGASTALGTEQRAHRVQQVLGRGVSRSEYLFALGLSAYLPFVGYILAWLLNALFFSWQMHAWPTEAGALLLAELVAGLLLSSAGLLFSALVAQMLAAAANGVFLALLLFAGGHMERALGVFGAESQGSVAPGSLWPSVGFTVLLAVVMALAAGFVFERRDLQHL
jgi:hypothetical protein